jgi:branched-chain amino acid transport system permease protein
MSRIRLTFYITGVLIILLFPLVAPSPFYIHIVLMVFLYAMMGQSWNILGGLAGQFSLGHAMFIGTGSYASAILVAKWGLNPWLGLIFGGLCSAILSQFFAYSLLRMSGHYFAVATIVMNEIVLTLVTQWQYCGGAKGLWLPIAEEGILNLQFHTSKTPYYLIGFALFCGTFYLTHLIQKAKLGYYLRAIKNEPDTASSRGINVTLYKCLALAISAFVTGVAGAFYSQYILFIDPNSVYFIGLSIVIALIPILGGMGTLWGPLVGSAILIPLSEFSRAYFGGGEKALDLLVYGFLIILITIYQPEGIMGLFKRGRRGEPSRA